MFALLLAGLGKAQILKISEFTSTNLQEVGLYERAIFIRWEIKFVANMFDFRISIQYHTFEFCISSLS